MPPLVRMPQAMLAFMGSASETPATVLHDDCLHGRRPTKRCSMPPAHVRAPPHKCTTDAQAEALEPGLTVLETLERAAPDAEMKDIKALLGRMMFSGKAMHKKARSAPCRHHMPDVPRLCGLERAGPSVFVLPSPCYVAVRLGLKLTILPQLLSIDSCCCVRVQVEVLSGGEKARLALAKFMLSQVRRCQSSPSPPLFPAAKPRSLRRCQDALSSPRDVGHDPPRRRDRITCSTQASPVCSLVAQHVTLPGPDRGCYESRLALRRWAFASPQGTLLVLDEPTNHLDIPSKEMLEEALQRFDGSVIAVSHDRYFLRRIATRVVTVPCSSCRYLRHVQHPRRLKGQARRSCRDYQDHPFR